MDGTIVVVNVLCIRSESLMYGLVFHEVWSESHGASGLVQWALVDRKQQDEDVASLSSNLWVGSVSMLHIVLGNCNACCSVCQFPSLHYSDYADAGSTSHASTQSHAPSGLDSRLPRRDCGSGGGLGAPGQALTAKLTCPSCALHDRTHVVGFQSRDRTWTEG